MLFLRYCLIATILAVMAMGLISIVEFVWKDSKLIFALAVCIIYGIGIIASYCLQARFTFRAKQSSFDLIRFAAIALAASGSTSIISTALRFGVTWPDRILPLAAAISFGVGCAIAGCGSFILNKRIVFQERRI